MIRPGKMIKQVIQSFFKKPATLLYPYVKEATLKSFRGKMKFYPEKCIGCKMCMRDCPSGAINVKKVGEKQFEIEIDLGKCIYCGQCADSCLKKAIEVGNEFELAVLDREKLKVTYRGKPQEGTGDKA